MRLIIGFLLVIILSFAKENIQVLQFAGVDVVHKHPNGEIEKVHIERVQPKECVDVHISYEDLFSGSYASEEVPKACKKSFVNTVGKLTPMKIAPGVKTIGELELLDFMKNRYMKNPQKYVLLDSRRPNWYERFTIPSALNLPFNHIEYDADFPEDFEYMKELLALEGDESNLDFSHAKTAVLFCNAPWCAQSPRAIKILLQMGYPPSKILWYRGGVESWLLHGFNAIKPKL